MNAAICAALGIVEAFALSLTGLDSRYGLTFSQTAGLCFFLQYMALTYYRVFLYHKYFSPLRHLPGPTDNHFLFGQSIKFMQAGSPIELYVKWMKEWPEAPFIRYLTFGNQEVIVANSIGAHKEVQQARCYDFVKPGSFRRIAQEFAGDGILLLEGEEHRLHRRMLAGPLSVPSIRKLQPIFRAKSQALCRVLDAAVAAGTGGNIDCTEVFTKATLDIIGATILGLELDNLTSETFAAKARGGAEKGKSEYTFHDAYEIVFAQSMIGKILLFANGMLPVRWIPIQANRDWKFCTDWVRRILLKMIHDRRAEVKRSLADEKKDRSETASRDLLTFIVEESMPGCQAEGLREVNFLGHLMQFMVAGHATSADTVTWCVYIMATRPDIQDKLRKEINDLLSGTPNPTYNDINACSYMEGFIKEALRIYAPSTSHHREANKDIEIETEGIFIPKGTTIDIVPSVTMLNPTIWGDDADTPDPTRWERLSGDQLSPYAFQAFANGPRMCIGKSYAMLEIKVLLMEMVPRFRFFAVNKPFTIENPGFAMRPKGLEVQVERIAAAA